MVIKSSIKSLEENLYQYYDGEKMTEISKKEAFSIAVNNQHIDEDDRQIINNVLKNSVESDVSKGTYSSAIRVTPTERETFEKYQK